MRSARRRRIFGRRKRSSSAALASVTALAFIGIGWLALVQPEIINSDPPPVTGSQTSSPAPHYDDLTGDPHSERIPATENQPARVVDVELTDDAIEPNPISTEPGSTVRFRITNRGTVVHEFRLTNGHDVEEHILSDSLTGELPDHAQEGSAIVVLVDPGDVREVDVEMPSDPAAFTIAACLIRGHYGAGMWTPVLQEPGGQQQPPTGANAWRALA